MVCVFVASFDCLPGSGVFHSYIVELADFLHESDRGGRAAWQTMRERQAQVADETPGVSLIRNSDLGEWNDIHPLDKKTLGNRVAEKILSENNNRPF